MDALEENDFWELKNGRKCPKPKLYCLVWDQPGKIRCTAPTNASASAAVPMVMRK
jgi:hypothetical protein